MMPLADAFNHKAAKVQLSGGYSLDPMCLAADSDSDDSEAGSLDAEPDEEGSQADEAGSGTGHRTELIPADQGRQDCSVVRCAVCCHVLSECAVWMSVMLPCDAPFFCVCNLHCGPSQAQRSC